MLTKQVVKAYIRSYWMVIVAMVIASLVFNALAYHVHTDTITPQEAYDYIYDQYPGNTEFAEYFRERCEVYGCRIGNHGLIVRDP